MYNTTYIWLVFAVLLVSYMLLTSKSKSTNFKIDTDQLMSETWKNIIFYIIFPIIIFLVLIKTFGIN